MKCILRLVGVAVLFLGGRAEARPPAPRAVQLPSTVATGETADDTIHFEWYPAQNSAKPLAPAVVVLHSLGGGLDISQSFARYLSRHGIGAAVMELPYHYHRSVPHVAPESRFLSGDASITARTWNQTYSDVSAVVTWMIAQPNVDATRLGAIGSSLGAVALQGTMGRDARLRAAVAFRGGGDFPLIYRKSTIGRLFIGTGKHKVTEEDRALLQSVDPLLDADKNRPRRVLMIQAARDLLIPPASSQELWKALGRPPIRWVDTGHFGITLAVPQERTAALSFLLQAWTDGEQHGDDASRLRAPNVYIPAVKAGFLSGLDSNVTPALTIQVLAIGTRPDHLAWVHADVGMTGRGPYVGLAATINSFVDLGIGRRFGGDKFRPYVGVQIAY